MAGSFRDGVLQDLGNLQNLKKEKKKMPKKTINILHLNINENENKQKEPPLTEAVTFFVNIKTNGGLSSGGFSASFENGFLTNLSFIRNSSERAKEINREIHHDLPSCVVSLIKQLEEYFSGTRKSFSIPIKLCGTDFQLKVWKKLLEIPFGEVRTYGEIAVSVGCPKGARAVGSACNKNPVMILVPCHRVVGTNGNLTGYAGGIEAKETLLKIEQNP